jgi:5-methylcytosine-specific restriction endonuclease McrA
MSNSAKRAGDRFGRLVLVGPSSERKNGRPAWNCLCDCGRTVLLATGSLGAHPAAIKSCGCLKRDARGGRPSDRHAGERYGRLLLLERVENNRHGQPVWRCLCDCGKETFVVSTNLYRQDGRGTQSCGCLHKERTASKQTWEVEFRHSQRQLYRSVSRARPGKRREWSLSIEQFKEIVTGPCRYCGTPPSRPTHVGGEMRHGIDRVDNARDYEPGNCVPCCTTCNLMKGDRTVAEFIEHVGRIHSHYVR